MYTKQVLRELGVRSAITATQKRELNEQGFFAVDNVVSPSASALMGDEFERIHTDENNQGGHGFCHVSNVGGRPARLSPDRSDNAPSTDLYNKASNMVSQRTLARPARNPFARLNFLKVYLIDSSQYIQPLELPWPDVVNLQCSEEDAGDALFLRRRTPSRKCPVEF